MRIPQVIGVFVTYARIRRLHRTGFQENRSLSRGGGGTLMHLTDGGAEFAAENSRFRAGKGDWVYWNLGLISEFRPLPGTPFSACLFCFKPLAAPGASRPDFLELPFRFRLRSPDAAVKLLHKLVRTFMQGGQGRSLACARLGLELLQRIHATRIKAEFNPEDSLSAMDPRIRSTLSHINERFKDRLLVKDLAFRVGMHPVHFTRFFTRSTGLSPHRYVLAKKIEKAKDFITTLEETPEATSMDLGFHDYSHFYRTFKRLTGMTPSTYVRAFRKGG